MSITFTAYTGPTHTSATLSGTLGRTTGDFSYQPPVDTLQATAAHPRFILSVGAQLYGTMEAPRTLLTTGYGLFGVVGEPMASFAQAPPQTVYALNAGFAAPQLTLGPAVNSSTTTLHATMRQESALFSTAGAYALRVRGPVPTGRFTQLFPPPQNYLQLVLSDLLYTASVKPPIYLLQDNVSVADAQRAAFIQALFDLMTTSDTYASLAHALQALTDGMSLSGLASLIYTAGLLDSFIASGVLNSYAQITALLADGLEFDGTAGAMSQILAAINDGLYIHVTLSTGQDTYTAWVMTPETKAMRSYSNWPFNSYAQLGNTILAAGAGGIYQLGGPTDLGAVISARVRSGLLDFGTRKLKRIDRAYLGYTSSGTLCLRVCATAMTGELTEYTYQMVAHTGSAPREGRIQVGRGTRSVYWSFELCNDASGSDFELYDMTVLPMALTGRII